MTEGQTTPDKPILLHESGPVFKYRGQETHGVPMTGTPDVSDEWEGAVPVLVQPEPPEPEPIPVRVIRSGGHEWAKMRVQRAYAGDNVSQIVGRDMTRDTVRIRNLSSTAGDRVWIAASANLATAVNGYPLDPGAEMTLHTEQEVYCTRDGASPTNPIPLAVLVEYTLQED